MFYCNHCGTSVPKGKTFCPNCGGKMTNTEQANHAVTREMKSSGIKLSKPTIFLFTGAIAVLVFLVAAHLVLSNIYKPEKILWEFEKAVETKDSDTIAEILRESGTDVDFDTKDVQKFTFYLTEENDFDGIMKELTVDLRKAKNGRKTDPVQDSNGHRILQVVENGKKFLIYKQYGIQAVPITIMAASNYDGVSIQVDGNKAKKLGKAEDVTEVGVFLPGEYKISGTYKGDYAELESSQSVYPTEGSDNIIEAFVSLEGSHLSLRTNRENAIVYINGKSTGKTIEEMDGFGPVTTDGSMKIYAVVNGSSGKVKSNVASVEYDEVELWFEEDEYEPEEVVSDLEDYTEKSYSEDELWTFMNEYVSSGIDAINARDFSYIADYHHPDGSTYAESRDYIKYLESKGITEKVISTKLVDAEEMSDGYSVLMEEEYYITYNDGSTKHKVFQTQYLLKWYRDSELKVFSLLSTNELSSTDL
ncbi:zinc ribbon domain-containing protein [Mesobacillus subterraneus]|uniref:zinc ribbon domain-containing protein n=1 Tax=Mesobacillus subterraneus TaxID=285983 RepID=UPI001CFF35FD|nr:zinc-ribbon domain-containing protein [Mesobacillus subterraneus]